MQRSFLLSVRFETLKTSGLNHLNIRV